MSFIRLISFATAFLSLLMVNDVASGAYPGPYSGSRILGNSGICAVYTEDLRRTTPESEGIYHLYVDGYQDDYILSCIPAFLIEGIRETSGGTDSRRRPANEIEILPDLFHTETRFSSLTNPALRISYSVFATADGTIVFDIAIRNAASNAIPLVLQPTASFRKPARTMSRMDAAGFTFANVSFPRAHLGLGMIGDSSAVNASLDSGTIALTQKIFIPAGETARTKMVLKCWTSGESPAISRQFADLNGSMKSARSWLDGKTPGASPEIAHPELRRAYESCLLALAATELRGAVPADMTGQFVTDGKPQLYPRDALMTARALLACGHPEPARKIIAFWDKSIPQKSPGEWYARYDADARATPGGSGAPYDLPEWDSNGYYASLLLDYFLRTGERIGDYALMKQLLDFVCARQDAGGLVREGGIIEWEGLLPATNMNLAAGLRAGAVLARMEGEIPTAARYRDAAARMESGLRRLFSARRGAYMDLRGADGTQEQFNTSANFGFLWGYPDHFELAATNAWYRGNTHKLGSGVQYFEADGYGSDLFGFTTGASAQYHALAGDNRICLDHLQWMMAHSNIYGMMPERVFFPDGKDVSPASPLSWCNAEFAMAIRECVLTAMPGVAAGPAPAMSGVIMDLNGLMRLLKAWPDARNQALVAHLEGGLMAARAEASVADQARILHDLLTELELSGDNDLQYRTRAIRMRFSRILANLSGVTLQVANGVDQVIALNEELPLPIVGEAGRDVVLSGATMESCDGNGVVTSENIVLKRSPSGFAKTASRVYRKGAAPYQTAVRVTLKAKWKGIPFALARTCGVRIQPRYEILQKESDGNISLEIIPHVDSSSRVTRLVAPRGWSVRENGKWNFTARPGANVPPGFHKLVLIVSKLGASKRGARNEEIPVPVSFATSLDLSGSWRFRTGDDSTWADPNRTDGEWKEIAVPAQWENAGYPGYDGFAWYRREVMLPPAWKDHDIELVLGAVDDQDWTYWNGGLIGHKETWNEERIYRIDRSLMRFDRPNVIAIRVFDNIFGGGIWKHPVEMRMKPIAAPSDLRPN